MWAIAIVAVIHVILGYAFVTGLAFNVLKKVTTDLKTFDVVQPPPPDKKPPPPPPPQPNAPPPIVSPPSIIRMPTPMPPIQTSPTPSPPAPPVLRETPAPPAPPAPPPPPRIEPAKAKTNLQGLISTDDYPDAAKRNNETGTVRVRLQVGPNGRVTGCSVSQSSGSQALDNATCRLLSSRARFTPAHDSSGAAVADSYAAPPIRWQLID
jgi:protein TonB